MKNFEQSIIFVFFLIVPNISNANWCTVTHIIFNDEYVKMDQEMEPFRIKRIDANGFGLAIFKEGERYEYRFSRNVTKQSVKLREFRSESMIFQLGLPKKNGQMIYRQVFVDKKGVERGFGGICS